jgi:hypothetical protein
LGLGASQRITQPIVEEQELDSSKGVEEFGVGTVGVGEGGLVEKTGGAQIADGKVVTTGGMGKGRGQEGFADAGRAQDEDIEMAADPFTLGKLEDETAVDAAGGRKIEALSCTDSTGSSMVAGRGNRATLSRRRKRLLSRRRHSWSTSRPRRSSKGSSVYWGL